MLFAFDGLRFLVEALPGFCLAAVVIARTEGMHRKPWLLSGVGGFLFVVGYDVAGANKSGEIMAQVCNAVGCTLNGMGAGVLAISLFSILQRTALVEEQS